MIEAETTEDLKRILAAIDVTVPRRSEGRTKEHVERYAAVRLLATIAPGRLEFPLRLTHRNPPEDRPDFLLEMGARSIGIEHTESVPQNQAHTSFLSEQGNGPDTFFISHALPGKPRKSKQQLLEEIALDDPGDGWAGDSPEREWADAMAQSISAKLTGLIKPGFQRFPENWLLFYDNWPARRSRARGGNSVCNTSAGVALNSFDCIFVVNDHNLWEFSRSGRTLRDTVTIWTARSSAEGPKRRVKRRRAKSEGGTMFGNLFKPKHKVWARSEKSCPRNMRAFPIRRFHKGCALAVRSNQAST